MAAMPGVGFCLLLLVSVAADEYLPVYHMAGERAFKGQEEICVDATHINLPMAGSLYSIEGWVMPDEVMETESFGIAGWGVTGKNQLNGFIFYRGSHSLRNIWWQNDVQAYLKKPLADGSYHHVAATWDGTRQRIFVDFVEVAVRQTTGYGVTSKDNFCVGVAWHQDGSRARFRGKMKDIKIWNIPIPGEDFKEMYGQQLQPATAKMEKAAVPKTTKYTVHTKLGFLNIHSEPGDPFRSDNVVGRLLEGEIVEVIDEPADTKYGPWLRHERGWSIQIYGGFHWLRPILEENSPGEDSTNKDPMSMQSELDEDGEGQGRENQDPTTMGSKLAEDTEHAGILLLYIETDGSDADLEEKSTSFFLRQDLQEALAVGLRTYFGFTKVWFDARGKSHASSGRQLRTSHAQAKVHFRARGGATLKYDAGLKTEIQSALDAAGADINLSSVSIEWKAQGSPCGGDPGTGTPSWYFLVGGSVVGGLLVACLGFVVYQRMAAKKNKVCGQGKDADGVVVPQVASPTLGVVHIADAIKVKKEDDAPSESTAEGDAASEGTVTSGDEPSPELYP